MSCVYRKNVFKYHDLPMKIPGLSEIERIYAEKFQRCESELQESHTRVVLMLREIEELNREITLLKRVIEEKDKDINYKISILNIGAEKIDALEKIIKDQSSHIDGLCINSYEQSELIIHQKLEIKRLHDEIDTFLRLLNLKKGELK